MIFIIGGRGFVGSAFARQCAARGLEHAVIGREDYPAFAGRSCDVLVNANGNSRKPLATADPLADFDASTRSVRATLEDFTFGTYVFLSSCDVYPDCSAPALTTEDTPLDVRRQSPYGFHKYLAEQCVRHAAARWLIVRQGGFVGPGLKKNAIYDILAGGPLWLSPESELQFLHTDDSARLVLELLERGVSGETVNVCGRGVVRLADAMAEVGRVVPSHPASPRVRYDVSVARLQQWAEVPETRSTVLAFLRAAPGRAADTAGRGSSR